MKERNLAGINYSPYFHTAFSHSPPLPHTRRLPEFDQSVIPTSATNPFFRMRTPSLSPLPPHTPSHLLLPEVDPRVLLVRHQLLSVSLDVAPRGADGQLLALQPLCERQVMLCSLHYDAVALQVREGGGRVTRCASPNILLP